jgi:SOS-response transcriptional repressor LexA
MAQVVEVATRAYPILNSVAASRLQSAATDISRSCIVLPDFKEGSALFLVEGDSMDTHDEAAIPNGCYVLVDRQQNYPIANRVFVICTHDGYMVKRMKFTGGLWWFCSDNPGYESWAGDECRIIGRVTRKIIIDAAGL